MTDENEMKAQRTRKNPLSVALYFACIEQIIQHYKHGLVCERTRYYGATVLLTLFVQFPPPPFA
jgi:hypothetical protein